MFTPGVTSEMCVAVHENEVRRSTSSRAAEVTPFSDRAGLRRASMRRCGLVPAVHRHCGRPQRQETPRTRSSRDVDTRPQTTLQRSQTVSQPLDARLQAAPGREGARRACLKLGDGDRLVRLHDRQVVRRLCRPPRSGRTRNRDCGQRAAGWTRRGDHSSPGSARRYGPMPLSSPEHPVAANRRATGCSMQWPCTSLRRGCRDDLTSASSAARPETCSANSRSA